LKLNALDDLPQNVAFYACTSGIGDPLTPSEMAELVDKVRGKPDTKQAVYEELRRIVVNKQKTA
jgi:hypothetical protein